MNRETIRAHVAEVVAGIAPEADLAAVDPDANLREALDIDSMDFLRLLRGLHARLGVDVPESEAARLDTLDKLLAWLERRLATAS